MTALTEGRNTPESLGDIHAYGVAASAVCFEGGIAVLNASGYVQPATTATGLIAVGRFEERVDNGSGANAAITARVKRGIFRFANSASSDEITIAEIGDDCYLVDDQTVAKTDGSSSRSVAGKVVQVDALGVWVKLSIA